MQQSVRFVGQKMHFNLTSSLGVGVRVRLQEGLRSFVSNESKIGR